MLFVASKFLYFDSIDFGSEDAVRFRLYIFYIYLLTGM